MENDCYVYYFHLKGVSKPDGNKLGSPWRGCRDYMDHFIIGPKWRNVYEKIKSGDWNCSGVHLLIGHIIEPHFSGNFWWANSRYIRKLIHPNVLNHASRIEAESWSGRPPNDMQMKAFSVHNPKAPWWTYCIDPKEYK